ncbi:ABC transporter transmembrane domain-containing protein [Streptomyces sp. KN37]|uniref:ABC transporter transmembrane domain-containing protein n=1 Tax=Streptomyces sp. KN37 TaxID=3090667 RepID=UPI002A761051|nr:ABC transporter transmembrane domain-containing protein [Streptomyces sp. KN37]WPO71249.1 ABC transporter transmembrane domain-containing protein [Streptomyces sp. KN37]
MPKSDAPASAAPAEGRSTVRSLLRLWPYVRPVRARLITAAVVAVVASCTGLLFPLVLKWMVDGPVADGDGAGVWLGALLLLALGVTEALLFGLRRWLVARPLARVEASMRADLFRHLQRLPVAFHDRWASGQLLSRGTTDLMLLRMFLAFPLTFLLVNGATILVGVVILLGQDFLLGLVLLAPVAPMVIVCAYYEGRYTAVARRAQDQVGDLTTVVEESVLGIRIIKGFGRHRSQARAFRELSHTLRGTELAKARILAAIYAVIMSLPEAAIGAALVLGTVRVADGDLSAGTLVAFLSTALALRWPVESIGFLLAMTQESATATERYFEVMDAEPEGAADACAVGRGAEGEVAASGGGDGGRPDAKGKVAASTGDRASRGAKGEMAASADGDEARPHAKGEMATPTGGGTGPHAESEVAASTGDGARPHTESEVAASTGDRASRGAKGEVAASTGSDGARPHPKGEMATSTDDGARRDAKGEMATSTGSDGARPHAKGEVAASTDGRARPHPKGEMATSTGGGARRGGGLRFHHVVFRYPDAPPDAPPVLSGIDLHIRPGETMALVGATGSGKTTLTALVPRLHEVSGGRITLDGEDITAMDRERLRTLVSVAFEEPTLFSATVGENVLMGAEESAGEAELARALDVAQADFAHALPQGTDTQVGEQGLSLSGGQRQRLALARAVVGRPRFLVLDDPLSALDVHTEALVEAALRRVLADTTALIVAHRPSTVQLADRVALLSGGRIAAVGTHQELLRENAEYAWLMSGADTTDNTVTADRTAEEAAR